MTRAQEATGAEPRPDTSKELVGMARGSGLNLMGALVSQGSTMAVTILIAHMLGTAALGIYSIAFAVRSILQLIVLVGMRQALTRFVAHHRAAGEIGLLKGAVRSGMITVGLVALAGAIGLFLLAPVLAEDLFHEPQLTDPLRWSAVGLPFFAIMAAALAATQGFSSMKAFAGISLIADPAIRLVLTTVVLAAGFGVTATVAAVAASSVISCLLALTALRRVLRWLPPDPPRRAYRPLISFALMSWGASVANQGLLWADVIIIGALLDSTEVGIYQVATRVVLLASIAVRPLGSSMSPRIADAWSRRSVESLRTSYLTTTRWTWTLSLPMYVIILVFADSVLRVFGAEFTSGETIIFLLSLGTLIQTQGAPASIALNMAGLNGINMVNNIASLVVNVVLNFLLIPEWGLEGAAVAWAVSLGVYGLLRMEQVGRLLTGSMPWSIGHTKASVAGLVAAAVGYSLQQVAPIPGMAALVIGSFAILLTYALVLRMLGFGKEDADLAGALTQNVSDAGFDVRRKMSKVMVQHRARRSAIPDHPVRLDELISPFRYDIYVRRDLLALARENPDLRGARFGEFVELARETSYFTWFVDVASNVIGVDTTNRKDLERGFGLRVRKSLRLLEEYDSKGGFDSAFPVRVMMMPAGATTPSGKSLPMDRLVPVDGCHRIALLLLDGSSYIRPGEYRIVNEDFSLIDNTSKLVGPLGLTPEQYYSYISRGFLAEPTTNRTVLLSEVGAIDPLLADHLERIMAVDETAMMALNAGQT